MKISQFIKKYKFIIAALFGLFLVALSIALNTQSPIAAIGIFGVWMAVSAAIAAMIYGY